jgi:hypothetical protein
MYLHGSNWLLTEGLASLSILGIFTSICRTDWFLTFICLRATTLSYDVAHGTVRSWRQNSFDSFSRWPWNTLRNYMCRVSLVEGKSGGSAIRWGAWRAHCVVGGGRKTVNGKRKLSAVFIQPIQNPSYMSHVLLLCISFLRVLVVLYLRVTCICFA